MRMLWTRMVFRLGAGVAFWFLSLSRSLSLHVCVCVCVCARNMLVFMIDQGIHPRIQSLSLSLSLSLSATNSLVFMVDQMHLSIMSSLIQKTPWCGRIRMPPMKKNKRVDQSPWAFFFSSTPSRDGDQGHQRKKPHQLVSGLDTEERHVFFVGPIRTGASERGVGSHALHTHIWHGSFRKHERRNPTQPDWAATEVSGNQPVPKAESNGTIHFNNNL